MAIRIFGLVPALQCENFPRIPIKEPERRPGTKLRADPGEMPGDLPTQSFRAISSSIAGVTGLETQFSRSISEGSANPGGSAGTRGRVHLSGHALDAIRAANLFHRRAEFLIRPHLRRHIEKH